MAKISENSKRYIVLLKIIFGLSLFSYIIAFKFDFTIFKTITFKWQWFMLMLLISTIIALLRTIKWGLLLKNYFNTTYKFHFNWKTIMTGQFFAFFTPSRLGDLIRIKYTKDQIGYKKSLIAVIIDRAADLFIMGFLALIGLIYFWEELIKNPKQLIIILSLVFLGLGFFIYILRNKLRNILKPFFTTIKKKSLKNAYSFMLIAFLVWILTFSQFYIGFKTIDTNLSFIPVFLIAAVSMIAIMMPISINGVGVREFMAMTFFPIVMVNGEKAVVALWIVMAANSLYPAILGFISFIRD
ncbi:MAG: lysylphosphatidylglycerol synthase transmembrane domain-containing protein [Nanobdellota archaeon]